MAWDEIGENIYDKIYNLEKQVENLKEEQYTTFYNSVEGIGVDSSATDSGDAGVGFANTLTGAVSLTREVQVRSNNETFNGSTIYDSIFAFNPYIIVKAKGDESTSNIIEIKWIRQAQHDGQILILEPFYKAGGDSNTTSYTLRLKTAGNINISSDTDVAKDEKIFLQWSENFPIANSSSGSWTVISQTSGSSGGGSGMQNPATAQLDMADKSIKGAWDSQSSTVGIESHLDMNTYNIKDVDQLLFATSASSSDVLPNSSYGIEADGGTSPTGIRYNVPSSKSHKFYVNGSLKATIDSNGITADSLGSSPSSSKYLRGDMTWQTISSGGSDNLGNHTATQTLDMGGYYISNAGQIEFGTSSTQGGEISNSSSGLIYDTHSSSDEHYFQTNGTTRMTVETDYIRMYEPISFQYGGTQIAYTNTDSGGLDFKITSTSDTFDYKIGSSGGMTLYNDGTRFRIEDDRIKIYKVIDIRNGTYTSPSSYISSNYWQGMLYPTGWVKIMVDGGSYKFPVWS